MRTLLSKSDGHRIALLLAAIVVATLLELIGIASIPVFAALLVAPDSVLAAIPFPHLANWVAARDEAFVLALFAAGIAMFFLVKNLYISAVLLAEARLLCSINIDLSCRLFSMYLHAPYTFHIQRNPAELVRNVTQGVANAVEVLRSMMTILREGLVLVVVLGLLLVFDPIVSLSVLVLLVFASVLFFILIRRSVTRWGDLAQAGYEGQLKAINQGLGAVKEAKLLQRESFLLESFAEATEELYSSDAKHRVTSALPRQFLEVVSVAAILVVAAIFMALGRPVEAMVPVLALLAVALVRLIPAFNALTASATSIRYYLPALRDIHANFAELGGAAVADDPVPKSPLRAIGMTDASFRYSGSDGEAVSDMTFQIQPGEAVAFIGKTGAGKTTIVDMLLGLLSPTSGVVAPIPQGNVGYVPQQLYLVDDTIRRNVAFGLPDEEIDESALGWAVRAARLDEFVDVLPLGLDTVVGDRGVRLSGGQAQRIGIARALYHDPAVLVFDEATAALDMETEREVMDAIDCLRGDRTLIVIAHRMSIARRCDRVFRIAAGRLVAEGPYVDE